MGSAGRVYYGRFKEGQLDSPFSGNLVDICPTGVFTDKTARFRARYWDYDMAPSLCTGCSLGCNTTPVARYRELLKITARRNDEVNGWFICDRGRFANNSVNEPLRPRTPLVDGVETSCSEALDTLLLRVGEIEEIYGPGSVAIVGSSRLAQEAAALLPKLAQDMAAGALCYFNGRDEGDRTIVLHELLVPGACASQQDVRKSDCIVICGCDPLQEAPMMALAVRQAWRSGASVYVVGEDVVLPCEFTRVAALDCVPWDDAVRPVIICSTAGNIEQLEVLLEQWSNLKLAPLFPAVNSYGVAQLSREYGAVSLEDVLADGDIKGVIAIEADIPAEMLEEISFLAVLDWRATATVQAAQIVIPVTAWVEMDGTYINNEGRTQSFKKVINPGLPIKGLDPAGHPPHIHRTLPPGGEAQPAWELINRLIKMLG
jgi:NADH-quinone oxidoreductase subunit G